MYAEEQQVRIGIENCPMSFSKDEGPEARTWPRPQPSGGGCITTCPSDFFGLNFDPSHFVWQMMDYLPAMREFKHKLFHVHAKDVADRSRATQPGRHHGTPGGVPHAEAAREWAM